MITKVVAAECLWRDWCADAGQGIPTNSRAQNLHMTGGRAVYRACPLPYNAGVRPGKRSDVRDACT